MSAWIFLLWTLAYALATRMSMWAATLIVAVVMAAAAAALIMSGIHRAKRIHPIPERTVESVKENLEWMKQPMVGVAAAQIKDYIGELVPGFDDHYRRAEQRAAVDPSRS